MRTRTHSNVIADPREPPAVKHKPVMLREALHFLDCRPGGLYVDATVGLGGHARAILEQIQPGGLLLGIDRDQESLVRAEAGLRDHSASVRFYHDNFKNLPLILNNLATPPIDGVLLDLGVSSYQLLSGERGFSFQGAGLLDMRMDRTQPLTAADLVNDLSQEELAEIIERFGEEKAARRIAAAISRAKATGPITRSAQLAEIIARAVRRRGSQPTHPATRTFQALRIAVNQELEGLDEFFSDILAFMQPGGRIVVIAFHSLEDRIVKRAFRSLAGHCVCERPPELCVCPREERLTILTDKPIMPRRDEIEANPRARSARLRAAARTTEQKPSPSLRRSR